MNESSDAATTPSAETGAQHHQDEVSRPIIQRHYAEAFHHCFGCGTKNEHGLELGCWEDGDEVAAVWTPLPYLEGPRQALHGGITALLMDEVGSAAAFVEAHRRLGTRPGDDPAPFFVTANLSVDYLKPIPIDQTLTIRARAVDTDASGPRKIPVECTIAHGDAVAARGTMLFVVTDPARYSERSPETGKAGN